MDAAEALARSPLFQLLGRLELAKLAGELEEVSLAPGEILFERGDRGDAFYVVRSGQAQVFTGTETVGQRPILIPAGQVIGEMAVLTGEPRSASIRAYTQLALWRMAGERFLSVVEKERPIALAIEQALSRRLASTLADASERQRDLQALAALLVRALSPGAARLLVRLSLCERWSPALLEGVRAEPQGVNALAELDRIEGLLRTAEDGSVALMPALAGPLAGQVRPGDRAWVARLARHRLEQGDAVEAVELLLAVGEAEQAAKLIRERAEAFREALPPERITAWLGRLPPALEGELRDLLQLVPPAAAAEPAAAVELGDPMADAAPLRRVGLVKPFAAVLALALLAAGWLAPLPADLDRAAFAALGTVAASLPLMLAEVLPAYVVTMLLAAGLVAPGLVSAATALSGFSSSSWLMIVILFSVSGAIAKSGLMYRLALVMLKRLPGHLVIQCISLLPLSMVLATGVASGNARVALAAPAIKDLAEAMGLKRHSRGSTVLGLVTFQLFAEMGSLFVTGSSTCLLLHGLIPEPYRSQVTWASWFMASVTPHLLLFALYLPILLLRYRPTIHNPVDSRRITLQLALLRGMTKAEVLGVVALLMLGIGFSTRPYHGIPDVWVALTVCVMLFVAGVLDDKQFQSGVNWGMMIYYGVLMGLGGVLSQVGIDKWLTGVVGDMLRGTLDNPYLFVFTLAAVAAGLRFVVPWTTLCSMLALVTMPLAIAVGYHPLIPVLVLLISTDHTFFPFINESYFTMYHASSGYMYDYPQVRSILWVEAGLRIVVLTASVPVWRMAGWL